jgi:hypothetical protein
MNIIQLSEQLKDVPDNFLLTEVQNPTGSYPAYLVVSELTRRKRMRSSAVEEPPQTTVAEDLVSPQQPMQPAGLGALAQPGEMAAQDAGAMEPPPPDPMGLGMPMGMPMEQPQMMAGGGLVAFRDGGDVIRAQSGMFIDPTQDATTFEDEFERYRPRGLSRLIGGPQGIGAGNVRYQLGQLGYSRAEIDQMDPGMQRMIVARAQIPEDSPAAPVAPPVAPPVAAPAAPAPSIDETLVQERATPRGTDFNSRIMQMISGGSAPTAAPDRAAGLSGLSEALPDTATPLMQQIIDEQRAGMEGRRGSNLNMALMQAGLGMMASPATSGIQGVAEGGLSGLKAYREGMADIQKSEQLMQASQLELAKAQDARSRGLFDLQLKSEANAAQLAQQARTSQLQGAQILATLEAANIRSTRGLGDVTPSPSEMKAAEDLADKRIMELVTQGQIKPASPQAATMKQQLVQQYLAQSGKVYMPMSTSAGPQQFDFNALMGQ